jgi:hypothetical protein
MEFIGTPEQQTALSMALISAQAEMSNTPKTAENEDFHSGFTPLSVLTDRVRTVFNPRGLAVLQMQDGNALTTLVIHKEGGHLKMSANLIGLEGGIYALGSAITYQRRYALMGLMGISPIDADDDGGAAKAAATAAEAVAKAATPTASAKRRSGGGGQVQSVEGSSLNKGRQPVVQSPAPVPAPAPVVQPPAPVPAPAPVVQPPAPVPAPAPVVQPPAPVPAPAPVVQPPAPVPAPAPVVKPSVVCMDDTKVARAIEVIQVAGLAMLEQYKKLAPTKYGGPALAKIEEAIQIRHAALVPASSAD